MGARPVRLGQNYKYVPKDVGINFENCLNFFWIRTGLAPARPVLPRQDRSRPGQTGLAPAFHVPGCRGRVEDVHAVQPEVSDVHLALVEPEETALGIPLILKYNINSK